MTKGTAEEYWASTAEGHFEAMGSTYQPGERADSEPAPKRARRALPPLTASQTIVDAIAAIAASAQPREVADTAATVSHVQQETTVAAG